MKRVLKNFSNWLLPLLASWAVRLLYKLLRSECVIDKEVQNLWAQDRHAILITWHEQILMMATGYPGPAVKLLISQSSDGEMLARAMQHFGYGAIRGSSSRGGRTAFKQMLQLAKDPYDIALTPDGPRGPRRELKDGVIQLARLTGRAVVPVAFVCSRGYRFHSWDRFLCPYPLARAVYFYGRPLYYDENDSVEDFRRKLLEQMNENQRRAEACLESYGVSAV